MRSIDELHLRRLTVDEALLKLDKYLDDAFVAGLYQVRVIHGKGTGTLRRVVREQLASIRWSNYTDLPVITKVEPELL